MFCSINLKYCKSLFLLILISNLLFVSFVKTKSLKDSSINQKKNFEKSLKRFRRSDEYSSITDPNLLAKQYALVHRFRSIDILGAIHQFPSGKIDTRDFGQNIHFGYRDRIKPGEKERALQKLTERAIENLLRMALEFI